MPPWELFPGSHIEAEAKLVTRKFIKSSIIRDIIFNSIPEYRSLSLFPIVESAISAMNTSNIATGTIRTTFAPGLAYLQKQVNSQPHDFTNESMCDYVEDYRSGSILDVIGSVGGLFALLQAMHILLFGRPLFWGLTGAKLITPFGLIGLCSTRGFKRRLRERYYSQSAEGGSEEFQIIEFLRDFVIDFGPVEPDQSPTPSAMSNLSITKEEDNPATQM
ncbi:hypothetical protein RSAG8_11990, partial [Rhizoctonia solani AG-8 WAC10335]